MDAEHRALTVAALVWGAFVLAGLIGRPFKMSAIVSVGGGFIISVVVAIIAKIYFEDGVLGVVAILLALWLMWGLMEKIFGK